MTDPSAYFSPPRAYFLLAGAPARADVVVANAVGDFSVASNPNGQWSYGEGTAGTTFNAFTNSTANGLASPITFSPNENVQYWQSSTPSSLVPLVGENFGLGPNDLLQTPSLFRPVSCGCIQVLPTTSLFVARRQRPGHIPFPAALLFWTHHRPASSAKSLPGRSANSLFVGALPATVGASETFSGLVSLAAGEELIFAVNNGGNLRQ